jgi:transcriptional regulator with XRE-family HTH domain
MGQTVSSFGLLLREWRRRRRISQLELALQANISTRHVSFLETGRSRPSRVMVLHLARELEVPLRDRNVLLAAAGFVPHFRERALSDPALAAMQRAVGLVLEGHMPYPALAVDRHWTMVAANDAVRQLLGSVDKSLLRPPVNVLRVALHPSGLAPRTVNLAQWRAHLLDRLRRQAEASGDPALVALLQELHAYPAPSGPLPAGSPRDNGDVVVPFELATEVGVLRFFGTTTVFGTPVDITLSELALECFYPADEATAEILHRGAGLRRQPKTS